MNSVSAAYATPLAPPIIVLFEFGSADVKLLWPITNLAACPVVKSAAELVAARIINAQIHFIGRLMVTFECRVRMPRLNAASDTGLSTEYSRRYGQSPIPRLMPASHTGVRKRHGRNRGPAPKMVWCNDIP